MIFQALNAVLCPIIFTIKNWYRYGLQELSFFAKIPLEIVHV